MGRVVPRHLAVPPRPQRLAFALEAREDLLQQRLTGQGLQGRQRRAPLARVQQTRVYCAQAGRGLLGRGRALRGILFGGLVAKPGVQALAAGGGQEEQAEVEPKEGSHMVSTG